MNELTKYTNTDLIVASEFPPDHNPAIVYLRSLPSKASRRTMTWALDTVAGMVSDGRLTCEKLPWGHMRYQHVAAIRAELVDSFSPSGANTILAALRGTLKQSWLLGHLSAEDYQRACEVKTVRGETLPAGRELSQGEINSILEICSDDPSPAGVRDAAILCLLIGAGLRRSEIVILHSRDYDVNDGRLVIRGKGRKERELFVVNGALAALEDWLELRGDEAGALLWPISKSGQLQPRQMSSQAIMNICLKRGKQAGIEHFSPHDARRTFITHMLRRGADPLTVAKLAGHASTDTTRRYDRRGDEAKLGALQMISLPYKRRYDETGDNLRSS